MEKLSLMEKYGKRRQITFRIGEIAEDHLKQVAALFNMKPSEYAKAVLYRELGVFNEPLDRRKHSWKKKQQQEKEDEDHLYAEDLETDSETESETKP